VHSSLPVLLETRLKDSGSQKTGKIDELPDKKIENYREANPYGGPETGPGFFRPLKIVTNLIFSHFPSILSGRPPI
jgi:hypothetical protein